MRIVREMDEELVAVQKKNADLESKLRIANYPLEQATNCGRCREYKHTPWKDDDYGFICATCLTTLCEEEKAELRLVLSEVLDSAVPRKKENPTMFMAWEKAQALLSNAERSDGGTPFTPAPCSQRLEEK